MSETRVKQCPYRLAVPYMQRFDYDDRVARHIKRQIEQNRIDRVNDRNRLAAEKAKEKAEAIRRSANAAKSRAKMLNLSKERGRAPAY